MRIGCNYWASNAGTEMWREWDEKVVRNDFKLMKSAGCTAVRVFPNWRDFQPLEFNYTQWGCVRGIVMHGKPLPKTPCGRAGVDEEMIRRFRTLCKIAEENGMELIVGLVTGWMSGSRYMPPALCERNPFTDAIVLRWEIRYVRCLVRELKDCKAIAMWELGNECNCMDQTQNSSEAWRWTNEIASAVRLEDPTRPFASGMHGLRPADESPNKDVLWTIEDQGELCDYMTAHPYPFSPSKDSARLDPQTTIRAAVQASVEMLLYSDMAGKPGFVEEIGTFAPSICGEEEKAQFITSTLYNSFAYGSRYFLWWCGFEQINLHFPPYTWSSMERELGLFDADFREKPVAKAYRKFAKFLKSVPKAELPPFRRDAVVVISRELNTQDFMTVGWSAFLLAKQNNFDVRFAFTGDELPDAQLYIIPDYRNMYYEEILAVLDKVKKGASVYVSVDEGMLSPFDDVFGASAMTKEARTEKAQIEFMGETFELPTHYRITLRPTTAEVLAREKDGNPVFLKNRYGKGYAYLLNLPLEKFLGTTAGVFHKEDAKPWRNFYAPICQKVCAKRHLLSKHHLVTVTEHPDAAAPDTLICMAINNDQVDRPADFKVAKGWSIVKADKTPIPAHTGRVITLKKTK